MGPAERTPAGDGAHARRPLADPVYPVAASDTRSWLLRRRARGVPPERGAAASPVANAATAAVTEADGAAGADPATALRTPPSLAERPAAGTGICLSGGGIRSAAYSLGVLQCLQEHGQLHGPQRADYLAAVSGGSYIAGAVALVATPVSTGPGTEPPDDRATESFTFRPGEPGAPDGRPFAPGTPEERYLRNHTRYLTSGGGGKLAIVWRCLLGIVLNVGFLALALHAVARPVGWLYGWREPWLRASTCGPPGCRPEDAPVGWPRTTLVVLGVVALVGLVSGLLWVGLRTTSAVRRWFARGTALGTGGALVGAVLFLLVPNLLALLRHQPGGRWGTPVNLRIGAGGGLLALTATAIGAARVAFQRPGLGAATSRLKDLLLRVRMPLLNALAAVLGPLMLAAGFVWFASLGAARPVFLSAGDTRAELGWWLGLAFLLLLVWRYADLVSWSLHPFYKERLASGFALRRTSVRPPDDRRHRRALRTFLATSVGGIGAAERPYDRLDQLSRSRHPELPELLVCAAANVNDYGVTPTGFDATSFVFSSSWIGGPLVGSVETEHYERAVGKRARDVTVPASVAIAGAAVAPSMGKMTRSPVRFLLTLTNLRLGVWTPNPRRVEEFQLRKGRRVYPFGPRPHYLLREFFGLNHVDSPYLYVSDGGHYENLGLVELLRRKCRWIWCVDASGDQMDTFSTLGQAMALARSELGVTIELTPEEMRPGPPGQPGASSPSGLPYAAKAFTKGTISYPGGTTGTLVVMKAGVTADAPWEVRSYYEGHAEFPCDTTLDQLYDAERFDAYRTLGLFAAQQAWEACSIDLGRDWAGRAAVDTTVDRAVDTAIDLTATEARR